MRAKDFTTSKVRKNRLRLRLATLYSTPWHKVRILRQLREQEVDRSLSLARSNRISCCTFNFNLFSDEECMRNFLFRRSELPDLMKLIGWTSGSTGRNRYSCKQIAAACILARRLAYPCGWSEVEEMFGMRASALFEVFWEASIFLYDSRSHLVTSFRNDLITERGELCCACIAERGAFLKSCDGLLNSTRIQMASPGGDKISQRVVSLGLSDIIALTIRPSQHRMG